MPPKSEPGLLLSALEYMYSGALPIRHAALEVCLDLSPLAARSVWKELKARGWAEEKGAGFSNVPASAVLILTDAGRAQVEGTVQADDTDYTYPAVKRFFSQHKDEGMHQPPAEGSPQGQVYQDISEHPDTASSEISKRLGLSSARVRKLVYELNALGHLEARPTGKQSKRYSVRDLHLSARLRRLKKKVQAIEAEVAALIAAEEAQR